MSSLTPHRPARWRCSSRRRRRAGLGADHSATTARFPAQIDLPDGWAPEGITAARGNNAYVGSLADGAIARVNLRTGTVTPLAAGAPGRVTVGIDYERGRHRIWAAGGSTSEVRAYDARTGALLQTYHFTSGLPQRRRRHAPRRCTSPTRTSSS